MLKGIISSTLAVSVFFTQASNADSKHVLPGVGSHFNISVAANVLRVNTTTSNHYYPNAGVQILTPGYTASGAVRSNNDGTYLFAVSDTSPVEFSLIGPGGAVDFKICLNGIGKKYSCEQQSVTVTAPAPPTPPVNTQIIFATTASYNGNLGGVNGADQLCQAAAYGAGSIIPAGHNFKALLITSTRYPCSNIFGATGCGGLFANDWPLTTGTVYLQSNNSTVFNTVNTNGVFDGTNSLINSEQGVYNGGSFWLGIQSILMNSSATDIIGWAYADMNSNADSGQYLANFGNCNDYTDNQGQYKGAFGDLGQAIYLSGTLPASTWGNYYYFNNTDFSPYALNIFNASNYNLCGPLVTRKLVCVS